MTTRAPIFPMAPSNGRRHADDPEVGLHERSAETNHSRDRTQQRRRCLSDRPVRQGQRFYVDERGT